MVDVAERHGLASLGLELAGHRRERRRSRLSRGCKRCDRTPTQACRGKTGGGSRGRAQALPLFFVARKSFIAKGLGRLHAWACPKVRADAVAEPGRAAYLRATTGGAWQLE